MNNYNDKKAPHGQKPEHEKAKQAQPERGATPSHTERKPEQESGKKSHDAGKKASGSDDCRNCK